MREGLHVSCDRTYRAPAARVYRAFTEPDLIRRWWSPDPTISVDVVEWNMTPGGRWRFAYRFPDGAVSDVVGVFRVRHARFPDSATRLRHDAGWNATLDRLPEILT
jgi:uncharacterized protein YndB with AHSA1/START domain